MQTIQISNGPSREELFDGLRLFSEKREVFFVTASGITFPAILQGIQAEDASGQSWNLTVVVKSKDCKNLQIETTNNFTERIKMYYSSKGRTGCLTTK